MEGKDLNNLAYTLSGVAATGAALVASVYICINPGVSDQVKLAFLSSNFITAGLGTYLATKEPSE